MRKIIVLAPLFGAISSVLLSLLFPQQDIVCQNCLVDNARYNAYDDGDNHWDNGVVGNYYSDLRCYDADDDGICDSEYEIPRADSLDRFPLASPKAIA